MVCVCMWQRTRLMQLCSRLRWCRRTGNSCYRSACGGKSLSAKSSTHCHKWGPHIFWGPHGAIFDIILPIASAHKSLPNLPYVWISLDNVLVVACSKCCAIYATNLPIKISNTDKQKLGTPPSPWCNEYLLWDSNPNWCELNQQICMHQATLPHDNHAPIGSSLQHCGASIWTHLSYPPLRQWNFKKNTALRDGDVRLRSQWTKWGTVP